jgi:hypothetical protein
MAAQTVSEVFSDVPAMDFDWGPLESPDPSKIWANYDEETDSFILYVTGKPMRGIHVWQGDDTYVIVDSASKKAIGLYVEHWQRSYVPAHKELQVLWGDVTPDRIQESAWISLMRLMALWVIVSFGISADDYSSSLQPA